MSRESVQLNWALATSSKSYDETAPGPYELARLSCWRAGRPTGAEIPDALRVAVLGATKNRPAAVRLAAPGRTRAA